MLLKKMIVKPHNSERVAAFLYRMPMPVKEVLKHADGNAYPVCPRCAATVDREYMRFCDRCGQRLAWEYFEIVSVVSNAVRNRI